MASVIDGTFVYPALNNSRADTLARGDLHNHTFYASLGRSLDPWQRSGHVAASGFRVEPAGGAGGLGRTHYRAATTNIPNPPVVSFVYTGHTRMASKSI
jgi:hypothetical protein